MAQRSVALPACDQGDDKNNRDSVSRERSEEWEGQEAGTMRAHTHTSTHTRMGMYNGVRDNRLDALAVISLS